MHEMSIAMSIFELALEEIKKQQAGILTRLRVEYGELAGIMPDALSLCFEMLIADTVHKNARLELVCLPLRLRCPFCNTTFGGEGQAALWEPCPKCGEVFGHIVEQGKELLLSQVEIEKN